MMNDRIRIKQYLVLRPNISPAVATIGVAHGVLASYLKWKDEKIVQDWVSGEYGPFYKCICQAESMREWEAIKKWENGVIITESKLDNLDICVAFKPFIWSKSSIFNELKLYDGKIKENI
jgi:hypothetical protein